MNRNASVASGTGSLIQSLSALHVSDVSKISIDDVYQKVLQAAIIDYRIEPRFRNPIQVPKLAPKPTLSPSSTSSSSSNTIPRSPSNSKRLSYNSTAGYGSGSGSGSSSKHLNKLLSHFDSKDEKSSTKLPKDAVKNLKFIINSIALKKTHKHLPASTRRCCLSFYSMIDQIPPSDTRSPEALIGEYTKAINKEIQFIKDPNQEINVTIFKEISAFISILIETIQYERNSEAAVAHLQEIKSSLESKTKTMVNYNNGSNNNNNSNIQDDIAYIEPPCGLNEMSLAQHVAQIFHKDSKTVQNDINRLKDSSTETALQEDLKGLIVSITHDSGIYNKEDFTTEARYKQWKEKEEIGITSLLAKLKRPTAMKRQTLPKSKSSTYYVIPLLTREYFIKFVEACLKFHKDSDVLFSNITNELIQQVATFWRINDPARASLIFTAANNTILNITTSTGEILDIDTEKAQSVLSFAFNTIKDENDMDVLEWPEPDKREWSNNIQILYLQTMATIRDLLSGIFGSTKPKFKIYLMFLEFIAQDPTFEEYIEKSGLPKKWERKLTLALGKAIDAKYVEILSQIPRDNTLELGNVYEAALEIIQTLTTTQQRFKSPFMGFLPVTHIATREFTSGFARDSKAMLYHIVNTIKEQQNGDIYLIPYNDCIELYQKLSDIRYSYSQVVNINKKPFPFKLEQFFYPFVERFVHDTETQLKDLTTKAFDADDFELKEGEDASFSKSSSSVKDCLSIFKTPLNILKDLDWQNEYQINKLYTVIIKGISEAITMYGYKCLDLINNDLNDEDDQPQDELMATQEEETNAMRWLSGVKAAVTGSVRIEPPKPYKFKKRTCVALNNLGAMLENIDRLEELINPEKVSSVIQRYEGSAKSSSSINLFSIKIVKAENLRAMGADGFSDTYVMLTDSNSRTTIGKTRMILDDLNPQWNEEFEFTVPATNPGFITATVWDDSKAKVRSHEIVGRTTIHLDPRKYNDNGIPHERWFDLDTQGRLLCSISMESEKVDALFCLGRAHRSLVRVRDRTITLMVNKFSKFIFYSLSRPTLKTICGSNGSIRPDKELLRSAIAPLGNYLNANLQVLAETLTIKLLFMIMLEAWSVILTTADLLLLPPLSAAKNSLLNRNDSGSTKWQAAVSSTFATLGGNSNRPLTQIELEVTFEWLKTLCVEFFYANGEGPPLEKLQDQRYQRLLLIPVHYVTDSSQLMEELQQLVPVVNKYIKEKNYYDISDSLNNNSNSTNKSKQNKTSNSLKLTRSGTVARSKTIMAQGSAQARAKAEKEVKEAESDPLAIKAEVEDIILRILIAKGEKHYVARRLEEREAVARITQTEILARAAAQGIRIV